MPDRQTPLILGEEARLVALSRYYNRCRERSRNAITGITHPGETINNAVEGTKTAVSATVGAVEAGSSYVANHVAKGDYAGMANDAVKTGEAVGTGIGQAVDHWKSLVTMWRRQ